MWCKLQRQCWYWQTGAHTHCCVVCVQSKLSCIIGHNPVTRVDHVQPHGLYHCYCTMSTNKGNTSSSLHTFLSYVILSSLKIRGSTNEVYSLTDTPWVFTQHNRNFVCKNIFSDPFYCCTSLRSTHNGYHVNTHC